MDATFFGLQVAKMLFEISDGTSVLHKTTARNLFKPGMKSNPDQSLRMLCLIRVKA